MSTPTTTGLTTSPTGTTGPTVAPGTFKITTDGKNVKITGNGVVKTDTFKLPENWYTVKETYDGAEQLGHMDYFEYDLMNAADKKAYGSMVQKKGIRTYYGGIHYPETLVSGTTDTFYVQTVEPTKGSWTIEFIAPPAESSVGAAPKTFTGTGNALVGPVKLPTVTGTATVSYTGTAKQFYVRFYQQDANYNTYPSFFINLPDADISSPRRP